MPVSVVSLDSLPHNVIHKRQKRILEGTEEWRVVRARLANGLNADEALIVTFTPEQQKELGVRNLGSHFREMLRQYCRIIGIKIDVLRYHIKGTELIKVIPKGVHRNMEATEVASRCALFE